MDEGFILKCSMVRCFGLKIINSIIGIFIIVIGSFFMNLTVENEMFQNVMYKIIGFVILAGGVFYLKKIAKFGKQ